MPHVDGGVIGASLHGIWRWWQDGIVGSEADNSGLGWHDIAKHPIANFELLPFPTAWHAQPTAFSLLPSLLSGACQFFDCGRGRMSHLSEKIALIA